MLFIDLLCSVLFPMPFYLIFSQFLSYSLLINIWHNYFLMRSFSLFLSIIVFTSFSRQTHISLQAGMKYLFFYLSILVFQYLLLRFFSPFYRTPPPSYSLLTRFPPFIMKCFFPCNHLLNLPTKQSCVPCSLVSNNINAKSFLSLLLWMTREIQKGSPRKCYTTIEANSWNNKKKNYLFMLN